MSVGCENTLFGGVAYPVSISGIAFVGRFLSIEGLAGGGMMSLNPRALIGSGTA